MKKRITLQDLSQLSRDQRIMLSELWRPEKYDVSVAYVCVDADDDKYEQIVFVVGNMEVFRHGAVYLTDLKVVPDETPESAANTGSGAESMGEMNASSILGYNYAQTEAFVKTDGMPTTSEALDQAVEGMEEPFEEDEDADEEECDGDCCEDEEFDDEDLAYVRPTVFNKEDCVPLLNIGQMIELLERNNFKGMDFYILAGSAEMGCEMGRDAANLQDYGASEEKSELCDVLWSCVKGMLG